MPQERDEERDERSTFGILDLARIIGGILFVNALLSWWFTSSSTWGYDGKWLDPQYLKLRATNGYVNLTLDELSLYNGTNPRLPIYVAVNGSVYDVSRSRGIYGPKGTYHKLSGKDSARVFVTGCFMKPDEYTYDLRGLDEAEAANDVHEWQQFFENSNRYWYAGVVQHVPLVGEPPEPCDHVKFPGYHGGRS